MTDEKDTIANDPADSIQTELVTGESATKPNNEETAILPDLEPEQMEAAASNINMIMEIPVTLSVQLGRTFLTIRQLLDLAKGSIVELEGIAGEPMDILVNDYLIAQGEVVVIDEQYGIRITDIITPSERLQRLKQYRL